MAEKTLNEPLTGSEIKQILLHQIDQRMNGDSNLLDDIAYAGFSATFEIKLSFVRSLTPPTLIWGSAKVTPDPIAIPSTEPAGDSVVSGDFKTDQPDLARQDHDLPIPVLAQTPSGVERRKVRIERPTQRK